MVGTVSTTSVMVSTATSNLPPIIAASAPNTTEIAVDIRAAAAATSSRLRPPFTIWYQVSLAM